MSICTRCHRPMKHPSPTGMGPTCSRIAKATAPETHERDLFGYDLDRAEKAARERLAIAIEQDVAAARMACRRDLHAARVRLLGWQP